VKVTRRIRCTSDGSPEELKSYFDISTFSGIVVALTHQTEIDALPRNSIAPGQPQRTDERVALTTHAMKSANAPQCGLIAALLFQ
jgi:hypothetical protein